MRLLLRPPGESFETLTLVYAVATVLGVRAFLEMTGYPRIETGTLHIAHVIWGGLLMLAAGRLALSFFGENARRLSAVLLGVGFGLFIDELGKFITQDNDYFFRPAAALIYASFVLLWLAARTLRMMHREQDDALLASAIEHLIEVVREDFDPHEKQRALAYLDQVIVSGHPRAHELALPLRELIASQQPRDTGRTHSLWYWLEDLRDRVRGLPWYAPWLRRLLVVAASFGLMKTALQSVFVLSALSRWAGTDAEQTALALHVSASMLAGFLMLRGLWAVRRSLPASLTWLERGFATAVLVADVFAFYFSPVWTMLDVLLNVVLLGAVQEVRAHGLPTRRAAEPAESVRLSPRQPA